MPLASNPELNRRTFLRLAGYGGLTLLGGPLLPRHAAAALS